MRTIFVALRKRNGLGEITDGLFIGLQDGDEKLILERNPIDVAVFRNGVTRRGTEEGDAATGEFPLREEFGVFAVEVAEG